MKEIAEAEKLFFANFANIDVNDLPLVFILGSPRTGSTLVYQLLINHFNFSYFSNFVNDYFPRSPVVGMALCSKLNPVKPVVKYKSHYGKTEGAFDPSEASKVFQNWFGGKHPSERFSSRVLSEQESHFVLTMKSIYSLTGLPLLTKNAWNCFRIKNLTELFPKIYFIWIRRDISLSAFSDLKSRYAQGSPSIWNSATTSNFKTIQKLPYWEQVVEQQYEFNNCIMKNLTQFCPDSFLECWYEEICDSVEVQLKRMEGFFEGNSICHRKKPIRIPSFEATLNPTRTTDTEQDDYSKIKKYISRNLGRLHGCIYKGSASYAHY